MTGNSHSALSLQSLALMLLAMTLIPLGDAAGKLLTDTHGVAPGFVAWSRFALGALLVLPFLAGLGGGWPRLLLDWRIWLRGLLTTATIFFILSALAHETMAVAFGAFFIAPIVSYTLSALVLREPITRMQTVFLIVGFAGVLMVVRPGFSMSLGAFFALAAGVSHGCFLTVNRWLRDLARPRALLMTQLLIGSVVLLPIGVPVLPEASVGVAALTLGSAAGSMLGNLCLIFAYRRTQASRLAPFIYVQLVASTALGFAVFGDWPDTATFAGLAVIIGAGLASFLIRPAASPAPPPPAPSGPPSPPAP